MSLEIARNPKASQQALGKLIDQFDGKDRSLAEALFLNKSLSSENLSKLISKSPFDLIILALCHPNLSEQNQIEIISSIEQGREWTKAKSILLNRVDLPREVLSILCVDSDEQVRNKAKRMLNDTYSRDSQ